jgi:hypothetical protein
MGFSITNFKNPPISAVFEKNGNQLNLDIDADIITPAFIEGIKVKMQREVAKLKDKYAQTVETLKSQKPKQLKAKDESDALASLEKEIKEIDAKLDEARYMAEVLSQIIVKWDVEDKDGQPFALSVENLMTLPPILLGELYSFCFDAIAPKKTNVMTSGATSQ